MEEFFTVKITEAAINHIMKEFQDIIQAGERPFVRLTMELC